MRTSQHAFSVIPTGWEDTQPQWATQEWDLRLSEVGGTFNASPTTHHALGVARWSVMTNGVDLAIGQALGTSGGIVGHLELEQPKSTGGMSAKLFLSGIARTGVFATNDKDEIVANTLPAMGSAALLWLDALSDDVGAFLRANPTPRALRHDPHPVSKKLLVIKCSKTLVLCAAAIALSTLP